MKPLSHSQVSLNGTGALHQQMMEKREEKPSEMIEGGEEEVISPFVYPSVSSALILLPLCLIPQKRKTKKQPVG